MDQLGLDNVKTPSNSNKTNGIGGEMVPELEQKPRVRVTLTARVEYW